MGLKIFLILQAAEAEGFLEIFSHLAHSSKKEKYTNLIYISRYEDSF